MSGAERTATSDLFHHLIGQRAYLIDKMSNAHQRGGATEHLKFATLSTPPFRRL